MRNIDFKGSNVKIGPPKNWNETLHGKWHLVSALQEKDNTVLAFQPSAEEVEAIRDGKPIFFQFAGTTIPVIITYVFNSKGEICSS